MLELLRMPEEKIELTLFNVANSDFTALLLTQLNATSPNLSGSVRNSKVYQKYLLSSGLHPLF
jgi:hypothetical protein